MPQSNRWYLLASGSAMATGALLHIAIIFGGPEWYAFLGAPDGLVAMAGTTSLRPVISCIVIAIAMFICSAYAFSGAGIIRKLPGLRAVLALIGAGLLARGALFVPVVIWQPPLLSGICGKCQEVNSFVLITSAICFFIGLGYTVGAFRTDT